MLIPLKQKYLESKPTGFKSRTSNQGKKLKGDIQGTGHRRRAYGPWWWMDLNSQLPIGDLK